MASVQVLRIFLSSPGDVVEERQLARDVIAELQREPQFEAVKLEAISWDDPQGGTPLPAQLDPQTGVGRDLPRPSHCHVVVGILWARMGSPLPAETHRKADGTPYLSGTECELEDAFAASPGPDVLLYRRSEEPTSPVRDPLWQEKRDQLACLDAYCGALKAAKRYIAPYATPAELKERLKSNLRDLLARRLPSSPTVEAFQQTPPAPVGDERLAQAQTRLAAMPLDAVPAPAPLPAGSRMPLARNALFVGREADLKVLAGALKAGETAAVGQIAAATGLGGIGKTQLASEFVHRYGQYFQGGVFWLSFADPEAAPAEIATCGGPGGMKLRNDFGTLSLNDQIQLVAAEWQGPLPRLLVFDNCEDEALLERWRPRTGGCRVLVTSRRETWSLHLGMHLLSLGVLSRPDSLALLRKHRPDLASDDRLLDQIAHELGDLPLALDLAGSYLARYRQTPFGQPAAYLHALRRPDLLEHRSLRIEGESPTGHERHVARTFALSYDRLQPTDETDAIALVTLARAAWFAAGEPIPRELLRASAGIDAADEVATLRFEDGLVRLRGLGLIAQQEAGALVLHRLLAAFVRSQADDAESNRDHVETAVLAEAQRVDQAGYPAPLLAWQPQLRFVAERAVEAGSKHAGVLLTELGGHLHTVADLAGAREVFERALRISEASLGSDHLEIAAYVNNLGRVLRGLGDLAGARAAFKRALAIGEKQLRPEHPIMAMLSNNLGGVLQDLGDLRGAKAAFERALKSGEQTLGPHHPEVGLYVNNLGLVLSDLGDLAGARAAFERALPICVQCLGSEHPRVATLVSNLGLVLQAQGDLADAKAAYERALKIDEASFGPDHPNVAIRVNNLCSVLHAQGDLAGARAACERALRIGEASFGAGHPQIAIYVNNLGGVLRDLGDLAGARAAFERALRINEASLGLDHPNLATYLDNLGGVLQTLGDLMGARAAFARALEIGEASFGPDNANVAIYADNLGGVLRAQGDLAGARAAIQRSLAIFERVLGPNHSDTRIARSNLQSLGGG